MDTLTAFLRSPMTFSTKNFLERTHNYSTKSKSPFSLPLFISHLHNQNLNHNKKFSFFPMATTAPSSYTKDDLPRSLIATDEPPALFDGTTRLYISYICPFAQRAWIARNFKGLEDKIKLVPIDLQNRPAWYKEKVYSVNKVPALEHNNEVIGESLDLLKYIDEHFEGPSLLPDDLEKKKFAEELLALTDSFNGATFRDLPAKGGVSEEVDAAFNKVEESLSKFEDGPFFLGQFSLVDIAFAPFIERFQILFADIKNYDITKGRPKLAIWIEELNKIDAYSQTRYDPQELINSTKKRLGIN